jgi:hypothetical protein
LVLPPKKGPGVTVEIVEPPNITLAKTLVFSPSPFEKSLARALFKASRKGKNKMVSVVHEYEVTSEKKGGFVKPP